MNLKKIQIEEWDLNLGDWCYHCISSELLPNILLLISEKLYWQIHFKIFEDIFDNQTFINIREVGL